MDWSKFHRGVFLVNVLAIIYDPKTKKILIGLRKDDPLVKNLTWSFPGGRPGYKKDLESYLKLEVKKKTGLNIQIKNIVLARTPTENHQFLLIYYYCEVVDGRAKAGEKFVRIKWVKPAKVKKYFTTSIHHELLKYLENDRRLVIDNEIL